MDVWLFRNRVRWRRLWRVVWGIAFTALGCGWSLPWLLRWGAAWSWGGASNWAVDLEVLTVPIHLLLLLAAPALTYSRLGATVVSVACAAAHAVAWTLLHNLRARTLCQTLLILSTGLGLPALTAFSPNNLLRFLLGAQSFALVLQDTRIRNWLTAGTTLGMGVSTDARGPTDPAEAWLQGVKRVRVVPTQLVVSDVCLVTALLAANHYAPFLRRPPRMQLLTRLLLPAAFEPAASWWTGIPPLACHTPRCGACSTRAALYASQYLVLFLFYLGAIHAAILATLDNHLILTTPGLLLAKSNYPPHTIGLLPTLCSADVATALIWLPHFVFAREVRDLNVYKTRLFALWLGTLTTVICHNLALNHVILTTVYSRPPSLALRSPPPCPPPQVLPGRKAVIHPSVVV